MFITKKIMANWRSWAMCIAIAFGCTVGAQETEEMSVKGEPPAEILWSTDFERRVQTPVLVDETQLSVISVSHFESGLYHDVRLWHVKSQSGKKEEIATLGQDIASWGGTGATSIVGNERGFFIKDGTKIVAMELETDNVSWESAVPEGGLRNLAFAEPGIIVANTSEGNVWALDARSGEMIWKFRVRSAELILEGSPRGWGQA